MEQVPLCHLGLFAKYWESGRVKTRLAQEIGADAARDVYLIFLKHLLRKFAQVADHRTVVYSPDDARDPFRQLVGTAWGLQSQGEGDLGQRMQRFFENSVNSNTKNILIGSDAPCLPSEFIEQAAGALDDCSVVLGPARDGGYYLVGMSGCCIDIFSGIEFSTSHVLAHTTKRLKKLNLKYELLPEMSDVDQRSDLSELLIELKRQGKDGRDRELLVELLRLDLE